MGHWLQTTREYKKKAWNLFLLILSSEVLAKPLTKNKQ